MVWLDEEKRKLPSARRELPLKIQNLQLEIHLFTTCAKLKVFNTSAELHLEPFSFYVKHMFDLNLFTLVDVISCEIINKVFVS